MKKAIVTTTINKPTEALKKFAEIAVRDGWDFIIVGDQKTPHQDYHEFCEQYEDAITYLRPQLQIDMNEKLSDLIGWNCIQRRNFGFIEAYNRGAEIIATIDDDNIPYSHWGKSCKVNTESKAVLFKSGQYLFDPLSVTHPNIWHRGFPIQLLSSRKITNAGLKKRDVLIQADLWDGDPDIDAVARITLAPEVKFNPNMLSFMSDKPAPFNSQNTFLSRKLFPDYFLFPGIGRMDDIWAAYYIQTIFPDSVIFSKASVLQDRNEHDLSIDLENEMIGYKNTLKLTGGLFDNRITIQATREELLKAFVPERSYQAYIEYKKCFK